MKKHRNLLRAMFVAVCGMVLGWAYFYYVDGEIKQVAPSFQQIRPDDKRDEEKEPSPVFIYFSDADNTYLKGEERNIAKTDDPLEMTKRLVQAIIQGSVTGLTPTIPEQTKLNAVYISDTGTAYVDFSADIRDAHPGGCRTENMTVYSIVNTMILNIPQINSVKLLIDGAESASLVGHIDLHKALKANMVLIR